MTILSILQMYVSECVCIVLDVSKYEECICEHECLSNTNVIFRYSVIFFLTTICCSYCFFFLYFFSLSLNQSKYTLSQTHLKISVEISYTHVHIQYIHTYKIIFEHFIINANWLHWFSSSIVATTGLKHFSISATHATHLLHLKHLST